MNPELYRHLIRSFVDSYETMMRRFPKPPENPEWQSALGNIPFYVCARFPTDGTPGANGSPAKDGGMGGNGGDSAEVYIAIAEDSPFTVDVISEPGLAGIGGRGGKGGQVSSATLIRGLVIGLFKGRLVAAPRSPAPSPLVPVAWGKRDRLIRFHRPFSDKRALVSMLDLDKAFETAIFA